MHWGQGILLGAVRRLMAEKGFRGPVGSFLVMNLRLLNDQTLENATGVGTPPWTWPTDEQVIVLLHKADLRFRHRRSRRPAHYAGPTRVAKR
jgi:hypothetical protein